MKKPHTRIGSFLLVFALILTLLPATVLAAPEDFTLNLSTYADSLSLTEGGSGSITMKAKVYRTDVDGALDNLATDEKNGYTYQFTQSYALRYKAEDGGDFTAVPEDVVTKGSGAGLTFDLSKPGNPFEAGTYTIEVTGTINGTYTPKDGEPEVFEVTDTTTFPLVVLPTIESLTIEVPETFDIDYAVTGQGSVLIPVAIKNQSGIDVSSVCRVQAKLGDENYTGFAFLQETEEGYAYLYVPYASGDQMDTETLYIRAVYDPSGSYQSGGIDGFVKSASGAIEITVTNQQEVATAMVTGTSGTRYFSSLSEAMAAAEDGDTVELLRDTVLDATGKVNNQGVLSIDKNITLDGNGKTLTAKNVSVSGEQGPSMINISAQTGVIVKDLVIDGRNETKHGLNIYQSSVSVENVTVMNNRWYAAVVHGSSLTASGLTTKGNQWGINAESKSGDTVLTIHDATVAESSSLVFERSGDAPGSLTASISGGSFQLLEVKESAADASISITGGTFAQKPEQAHIADGYQVFEADGLYIVGKSVSSVALNKHTLELYVDGTETLIAAVDPDDAYGTVVWASDNEDVATVDQSGTVTAVGVGETTITASVGDKSDTCTVTVSYAGVTSVTLNATELTLTADGTTTLTATVLPAGAEQTVVWSSSHEDVATVENGVVTAVSTGTTVITAKAGEKEAACTVTVTAAGEIITDVADPDVKLDLEDDTLSEEQKDAIKDAAGSVSTDSAIADAAQAQGNSLSLEEQEALKAQAESTLGSDNPINLFTQAYLEITATGVETGEDDSITSITLDITPMVQVVASTASSAKDIAEGNSVVVKEAETLSVETEVEISVELPGSFAEAPAYVKHQADSSRTYFYKAVYDSLTGKHTFTTPHGFSPFTFSLTNGAAAQVGEVGYASLQEAVDAVSNEGTITLTNDNDETIEVRKDITFTLDQGDYAFNGTISAGSRYEMTVTKNDDGTTTYAFARISDDSSDDDDEPVKGSLIAVTSTSHGTVRVNPGRAEKGETVTITAVPNDGYVLKTLTVTDKSGDTIKVSSKGNDKYTFTMPNGPVTVKAVFARENTEAETVFTDVPKNFWAYNEISWALEKGYMKGTTATTFTPSGTVTRQQVWMVLARMAGANPADMAAAKAWAVANGISDGTNPGSPVTRQQLVALLYRFAAKTGHDTNAKADLSSYPDASSVAAYAADAMAWAVAGGIINGTTQGTLNPAGPSNRAQFAVMLWRFHQAGVN